MKVRLQVATKNADDANIIEMEILSEEINNDVMQSDKRDVDDLCHSDSCLIDEMPNSKESNIVHCYTCEKWFHVLCVKVSEVDIQNKRLSSLCAQCKSVVN